MNSHKSYKDSLIELLKELKKNSVKFVVCGGIASVLHGVERNTYDLDLSVALEKENLYKIIDVAKKYNLIPRIPEPVQNLLDEKKRNDWIEKKGALVYTFVSKDGPLQMDIFLKYPKSFEELLLNADKVIIDDLEILISSKEDLIAAKKKIDNPREKDLIDIRDLKKIIDEEKKSKDKKN